MCSCCKLAEIQDKNIWSQDTSVPNINIFLRNVSKMPENLAS